MTCESCSFRDDLSMARPGGCRSSRVQVCGQAMDGLYDRPMAPVVAALLVAAKVWHYWLSIALLAPIVLLIVAKIGRAHV